MIQSSYSNQTITNQVEYLAALQTISGCERCTKEFNERVKNISRTSNNNKQNALEIDRFGMDQSFPNERQDSINFKEVA